MSSIVQLSLFDDKHCPRCGLTKNRSEFHARGRNRDGKALWCKSCSKEYKQQWYLSVRDEYLVKFSEYRKKNIEYFRTYDRAYYIQHKEHMNEQARKWVRANRDAHLVHWHARRARERQAEGRYTAKEWRSLCEWFGNYCLRCGAHSLLTVDHVIPLTKGGANHIGNLQPLCKQCNSIKREQIADYRDPIQLGAFLSSLR